MDKTTVKELYRRKDRKRKIALFKVYSNWLFMDTSLKFIKDRINQDLEFNLVTENDIKYIRHRFKKKIEHTAPAYPLTENKLQSSKHLVSIETDISWTNPDEVGSNQNSLKSKFSK